MTKDVENLNKNNDEDHIKKIINEEIRRIENKRAIPLLIIFILTIILTYIIRS